MMKTKEQVMREQERLRQHYKLSWWYGTACKKCCDVYPKLMTKETFDTKDLWYECEVCGRRTNLFTMPHLAQEAWNKGETYIEMEQVSLYD